MLQYGQNCVIPIHYTSDSMHQDISFTVRLNITPPAAVSVVQTRAGLRLKQYNMWLCGVITDDVVGLCGDT